MTDLTLDSLTDCEIEPPHVIIYGGAGVGKTTWAASAPKPVMIRTEKVGPIKGVKMFPQSQSFDDVMSALTLLATEDHDFETLIVDSIDWLETLVWKNLIEKRPTNEKGRPVNDITDYGFGKGFVHALDYWGDYIEALNYLRDVKKMAIIQVGHAQTKRFDDPTSDSYDRYQLKLHDRAAEKLAEGADCVLFAKANHSTTKEDVGFNSEKTRAVGAGERFLHTDLRPAYDAKNRYDLPERIAMPRENGFWELAKHLEFYQG